MTDVTIYTTNYCPFCARAKALLDREQVTYNEIDVTYDPALRAEMQSAWNRPVTNGLDRVRAMLASRSRS